MRKTSYFPYFTLVILLFFMLSLPQNIVEPIRSFVISGFAPPWARVRELRSFFLAVPTYSKQVSQNIDEESSEEFQRLQLENRVLREQMQAISEWLMFDQKMEEQVQRIETVSQETKDQKDPFWRDFFQRRSEELKACLDKQIQAYPAQVIFREPSSWCSSMWINIGEEQNAILGKSIIAKNSPVLSGQSLIGIVEYVGSSQSRIRLITDSGLRPSVRAVRGAPQDQALFELVQSLLARLDNRTDLFQTTVEKTRFLELLTHVKDRITQSAKGVYLAKGELHGSSYPLWRSRAQTLKGIGFNYDYADLEGGARDLLHGNPRGSSLNPQSSGVVILKSGDLLVTSGLDGVFPPGLHVALVSKVHDLEDGSYYYKIEAKPTAGNLDDLSHVFILPPLGFDTTLSE